ncbi:hypothetical protein ACNS7O_04520 [Haloferacaceae archaeon DSL9]
MLVYLHQYRADDAKDTVRSEGSVSPEMDGDEYFNADDVGNGDGWERVQFRGETLLRRAVTYDEVAAVSVPQENLEETSDLPGDDVQLRRGGEETYVEAAKIIEVVDENP